MHIVTFSIPHLLEQSSSLFLGYWEYTGVDCVAMTNQSRLLVLVCVDSLHLGMEWSRSKISLKEFSASTCTVLFVCTCTVLFVCTCSVLLFRCLHHNHIDILEMVLTATANTSQ